MSTPSNALRTIDLRWVTINDLTMPPVGMGQRDLRPAHVDHLLSDFRVDETGIPLVCARAGQPDGPFLVSDGQHRIQALKDLGYGDRAILVEVRFTEDGGEVADAFLRRNDTKALSALDKFFNAVTAGRPEEVDIDRVVRAQGLHVSSHTGDGHVMAVAQLRYVYQQARAAGLGKTLRIVRDAFGESALDAAAIGGIGMLVARYGDVLDEQIAVDRLGAIPGGINGLITKANVTQKTTGRSKRECIAAAAVDVINAGRGKKHLPNWWQA